MSFVAVARTNSLPCFARGVNVSFSNASVFAQRVSPVRSNRTRVFARPLRSSRIAMAAPELVSPQEAQRRKSATDSWTHLDVRTVEEFAEGHAPSSQNIPFLVRGMTGMSANPDFFDQVAALVPTKTTKLLISCASGKRSAMACAALEKEGYENLADLDGGYSAWAQDESLPVERS